MSDGNGQSQTLPPGPGRKRRPPGPRLRGKKQRIAPVTAAQQEMLDELATLVGQCQLAGGDCREIRVCLGNVCRSLKSSADGGPPGTIP